MHKKLLGFVFMLFALNAFSQIVNPVSWSWKAEHVKDDQYKIIFTATIEKNWHTYSMYQGTDGAVPTSFKFEKNVDIELIGKMTELSPHTKEGMDDVFGVYQKSFAETAVFTQLAKVKNTTKLSGSFEFMVCDDKTCLPPTTKSFSVNIETSKKKNSNDQGSEKLNQDSLKKASLILPAVKDSTKTTAQSSDALIDTIITESPTQEDYYKHFFNKEKFGTAVNICTDENEVNLWWAILLGFIGGLLAVPTPCVFPMIPLTISFFTKRNEDKAKGKFESVFYGFSIMFIFFLMSVPFLLFNLSPNLLNEISTNAWINLLFFFVFIVFAFSFFGFYEITIPSSFANKVDNASNAGGLIGIFLMALTLVLVSFSCTGPLLGSLLPAVAKAGGKLNLVAGMTAFGFALGLPFTLFAFFPGLLNKIPKSGSWMVTLKVIFGFLELIFAFKFLSNADLAFHWGLLKRETFLLIWTVLSFALALYILGILKFKDEGPIQRTHPLRLSIAALSLAFGLYCGWGVLGNDLPLLSGFNPPNYYSWYPKKSQCPNELPCLHDYDEALALAKKVNKPVFIDFTGYNCANCRRMEENIWIEPEVYNIMEQKYVIASLYVDDYQRKLPDSLEYISPYNGEKRTSYGHKWSDLQTICFNSNTQPQYVLVSPDERILNIPWSGYNADAKKFLEFLRCGLEAHTNIQKK